MRFPIRLVGTFIAATFAALPAMAELVPGRIYYSLAHHQGCSNSPSRQDLIMEFDPVTGQTREWWRSTPATCGGIGGFAVPPGGGYMRAIDGPTPQIVNIRSETDFAPFYNNSAVVPAMVDATFAANGDYYVSTPARSVVRFAADGSPPEILAQDWPDDLRDWGFISPAPQGGVFYGETYGSLLQHVGDDGTVTTVADLPLSMGLIRDLTTDQDGNLFILTSSGLLRMAADEPGVVATYDAFSVATGRLSYDSLNDRLFVYPDLWDDDLQGRPLYEVDLATAGRSIVGAVPALPDGYVAPLGFVYYTPEPAIFAMLLVGALAAYPRTRRLSSHLQGAKYS